MFKSQNDGALRRCQVLVVRNTRLVTFRCSGLFPQFGSTAATFLAKVGTLTRCFGTNCFIKCTHQIAVCYMAANADSRRNFRECLAFSVLCRSKHQHDVLEAMCWALYAYVVQVVSVAFSKRKGMGFIPTIEWLFTSPALYDGILGLFGHRR